LFVQILIQDHENSLKRKKPMKQSSTILPGPALTSSITALPPAPGGDENSHATPTPQPILSGEVLNQMLPIHAKLFEKHRVESLKRLFRNVLWNEVTYHARCLEAYSHLLECLDTVEDVDEEEHITSNA
jgi:hypothetical protein